MKLKRITFRVLVCLILSLLLSLFSYLQPMHSWPGFVALLLRDGALIVFLSYLYRRS